MAEKISGASPPVSGQREREVVDADLLSAEGFGLPKRELNAVLGPRGERRVTGAGAAATAPTPTAAMAMAWRDAQRAGTKAGLEGHPHVVQIDADRGQRLMIGRSGCAQHAQRGGLDGGWGESRGTQHPAQVGAGRGHREQQVLTAQVAVA